MTMRVVISPTGGVRGRAIGVLVLAVFGASWLWLGALNSGWGTLPVALSIVLAAIALAAAAFFLLRATRRLPEPPLNPATRRFFLLVNAVQWIAIVAVSIGLVSEGAGDAVPAAVAAIVGLHFLPLAWLFRAPVEYVTGAAMFALAAWFGRDYRPVLLGAGVILWSTALWQLAQAIRALRNARQTAPA